MTFSDFIHRIIIHRPASRQKLAQLEQAIQQNNNLIMQRIDSLEKMQSQHFERTQLIEMDSRHDAACQHELLQQTIDSFDIRATAYLQQMYFANHSNRHQASIDLFASIPAATGNQRIFQLALAKLMYVLDSICSEHNIRYWLCWGTLLASRTRQSSIPWDDDIDIGITREGLEKLKTVLLKDKQYQISTVYDRYVLCKQYRFSARDTNNPCFIDLGVFDWAPSTDPLHDKELKALRQELMNDLNQHMHEFTLWNQYPYLFAEGSDDVVQLIGGSQFREQNLTENMKEIEKIDAIFNTYHSEALRQRLICNDPDSAALAYGLENLTAVPSRTMLFPTDAVFPTESTSFEEYKFQTPCNSDYILDQCYSGWPYIPTNMFGHQHFSQQLLQTPGVVDTLRDFISKA